MEIHRKSDGGTVLQRDGVAYGVGDIRCVDTVTELGCWMGWIYSSLLFYFYMEIIK